MRSTRAFVIGIGTAFFFDPRLGKRRRSVARDSGVKAVRQVTRTVARITATEPVLADAVVEQSIRRDALREVDVSPGDLEIGVEDGLVTITGEVVGDKRASDLVARIGQVPGVENVAAMIHVVNEQPNDRAA